MASYTYTLRFTDAKKTSVVANLNPAAPAGGFDKGDDLTFTSADGPWHVIYPESPFHTQPRNAMLSGAAGEEIRVFINPRRTGSYKFRCLIDANGQSIGWADAGGDTNIKTT